MKASTFIATSVDGVIARANGAIDWWPQNGGEPHGYVEFMATVDAIVIGRKTFETVLEFEVWPYERPVVVLASNPDHVTLPPGTNAEVMNATPQDVVDRLCRRGMSHRYVDGGVTVQRFLAARLLQRLIITRVPALLGTGIPLFGPLASDVKLEHVETQSYRSGLVRSECLVRS